MQTIEPKAMPWWEFGGAPHCLPCLKQIVPDNGEINGGYRIETDTLPTCPRCGCDLDLIYIGDDDATTQNNL